MPRGKVTVKYDKTTKLYYSIANPRKTFKKKYGNKREVWKVQLILSKIRASARILLTLPENDPRRLFQGKSLIQRLRKFGILEDEKQTLDNVLSLKIQDFLERRLQTLVFKTNLSKSIHHARVLIRQRHISVKNSLVDIPSFMVGLKSQDTISFFSNSPFGGGEPGRVRRKTLKQNLEKEDNQSS